MKANETKASEPMATGPEFVKYVFGDLQIYPPLESGNVARAAMTPDGKVAVTLNGQTSEFDRATIWSISFWGHLGGTGGGNTFANLTDCVCWVFMKGGGNKFDTFGPYTQAIFEGDGNTIDLHDNAGTVYTNGGKDNKVTPNPNMTLV